MYRTPNPLLALSIPGSEATSIYNYLSLSRIEINVTDIPGVIGPSLIKLPSKQRNKFQEEGTSVSGCRGENRGLGVQW